MHSYTDADRALDSFISSLTTAAAIPAAEIVRFQESHSDRSFEFQIAGRVAKFTAKMSLTDKSFWGLTEVKAAQMAQSAQEHLLLLTGPASGYFISAIAFRRLYPKFSRTRERAVRINPNIIKRELRFANAEEALEMLEAKSVPAQ